MAHTIKKQHILLPLILTKYKGIKPYSFFIILENDVHKPKYYSLFSYWYTELASALR